MVNGEERIKKFEKELEEVTKAAGATEADLRDSKARVVIGYLKASDHAADPEDF